MNLSYYMSKLKESNYCLLFALMFCFAVISLISAYFTEFVLGFKPCPLCLYQRIPYFVIIVISIISVVYKEFYKLGIVIIIFSVFFSILIAGYHSGVEKKFFSPLQTCIKDTQIKQNMSLDNYIKFIDNQEAVSCNEPPFRILGLSMADYNFLMNIFVIYFLIKIIFKKNLNEKTKI